jgi:hypothetical protein
MVTKQSTEQDQVLWMADCYSLAKRFPNPQDWLALLEPVETADIEKLNPFHYCLWMQIWKAAQLGDSHRDEPNLSESEREILRNKAIAGPSAAKCPS